MQEFQWNPRRICNVSTTLAIVLQRIMLVFNKSTKNSFSMCKDNRIDLKRWRRKFTFYIYYHVTKESSWNMLKSEKVLIMSCQRCRYFTTSSYWRKLLMCKKIHKDKNLIVYELIRGLLVNFVCGCCCFKTVARRKTLKLIYVIW